MNDVRDQLNSHLALNADQLSEKIGLSKDTIYTLVSMRKIPHLKVGRRVLFPVKGIEKWLEVNTISVVDAWS